MGCSAYTYCPVFEPQKKRFKKELTSEKTEKKARSVYLYGFGGQEKDDEIKGTGNSYDMGARLYDPRIGRTPSIDPLANKYPYVSPYAYCLNNPLSFVDPDGRDVILVIWATANGEVGHAGIAVSNYKQVQTTTVVNGQTVTQTQMVPDGTYTYYDNWPDQGVNLGGIKGAIKTVDAYRSHDAGQNGVIISDISDFTSGNLTTTYPYDPATNTGIPSENRMQEGVLEIKTDFATDEQVKATLNDLNANKTTYNGKSFNCSSYVSCGLEPVLDEKVGKETVLGPLKAVTPNQLWKDVVNTTANKGIQTNVLVDPGTKVNNSFKEGINQQPTPAP
jgi:RHS repeat-associated protein